MRKKQMFKETIVNPDLQVTPINSSDIQLISFNTTNLKELGFIDEKNYPTDKLKKIIEIMAKFSPTEIKENAKRWDIIDKGVSLYNVFLNKTNVTESE
jgi:hypothetical protein